MRRYGRALIAIVLLGALLVPAVGSVAADDKDRLEEITSELEDIRAQIAEHQEEAGSLRNQLDALNQSIARLEIVINDLNAQIAAKEARVRATEAEIAETQAKIDKIKKRATAQAVLLYKAGSTEALDAILNTDSITVLTDKIEMMGAAATENTDALITYGRLQLEIQKKNERLLAEKADLDQTVALQEEALMEKQALRVQVGARYAELSDTLEEEKAEEGNLENAAEEIKQDILAAQAAAAAEAAAATTPTTTVPAPTVPNLGNSAQGFIWPLNGAVTSPYGYRWGRMHTGIDIDGVSGQAVVSSKAGRVILAASYSGYGNAVIIDHGGGFSTLYGHLSSFAVSQGQSVGQGQVVGAVGCTGSCTGDHLHFEIRINGNPVNPMGYLP